MLIMYPGFFAHQRFKFCHPIGQAAAHDFLYQTLISEENILHVKSGNFHRFLFSFVFRLLIKCNQVKHASHSAPHSGAIPIFYLVSVKVGGAMSFNLMLQIDFMPRKQDLPHYITVLAKEPTRRFNSQIIKTIISSIPIILNRFIPCLLYTSPSPRDS